MSNCAVFTQFCVSFAQIAVLAACGAQPVATDVQVVGKPVKTACTVTWPKKPTPHVRNVQRTGNDLVDAVLVWRAAEAEMEERRAYEKLLEAAAKECVDGG